MGTCSPNLTPKDPPGCPTSQRSQTFFQTLLLKPSVAPNFNSVPHGAPSAPTQPPYGSLRSTWAISQIPWESRIQPDISIKLKMGSRAPLPASQLPKLLSIPNCLASLPRKTRSSKIPHRFSRPGGSLHIQSLTPASPFPDPSTGGKEPSSAPGEGPWRAAIAGGDGGLQGEARSRKEDQFPRVER